MRNWHPDTKEMASLFHFNAVFDVLVIFTIAVPSTNFCRDGPAHTLFPAAHNVFQTGALPYKMTGQNNTKAPGASAIVMLHPVMVSNEVEENSLEKGARRYSMETCLIHILW